MVNRDRNSCESSDHHKFSLNFSVGRIQAASATQHSGGFFATSRRYLSPSLPPSLSPSLQSGRRRSDCRKCGLKKALSRSPPLSVAKYQNRKGRKEVAQYTTIKPPLPLSYKCLLDTLEDLAVRVHGHHFLFITVYPALRPKRTIAKTGNSVPTSRIPSSVYLDSMRSAISTLNSRD